MAGTRFLYINSIALLGYAIFLSPNFEKQYLGVLLLLLPLIDKSWKFSLSNIFRFNIKTWTLCFFILLVLMVDDDRRPDLIFITVLFVALPEEWFFRAYFYDRLTGIFTSDLLANTLTSAFFALLHVPVHGVQGLLVFIPSLFFGWIYQHCKDLTLVILIHAMCNYIYFLYIDNFIELLN